MTRREQFDDGHVEDDGLEPFDPPNDPPEEYDDRLEPPSNWKTFLTLGDFPRMAPSHKGGPPPLETVYRGIRFRSRLEARWAVYLRWLHIDYAYEPTVFDLGNGLEYLPDFWLPTYAGGVWLELKPVVPTEAECHRAQRLAEVTGQPVYVCWGLPGEASSRVWGADLPAFVNCAVTGACAKRFTFREPGNWWE